jgi:uncharacterized membrane protein YphA (DoxX/SURF4 family)
MRLVPSIPPRRHALLLAAGVHFGMGGSIFGTSGYLHDPDKAILWEAWPADVRAALWLAMGVFVLVGVFSRRMEVAAFALAVVMPFERAIGHLWSWWQWVIPEDPGGDPRGLAFALVWLSFAGFIGLGATIVHLPQPPDPPEGA